MEFLILPLPPCVDGKWRFVTLHLADSPADELSLLEEPFSLSCNTCNASAHITAMALQSHQRVGGSVIRCKISRVTLNKRGCKRYLVNSWRYLFSDEKNDSLLQRQNDRFSRFRNKEKNVNCKLSTVVLAELTEHCFTVKLLERGNMI